MSKPLVIGISGGSGSGKTTFIHRLKIDFSDSELCIVSQDNYYKPREEQLKDQNGILNFDIPQSINKKQFRADLQKLINGEVVELVEYTFNNEKSVPQNIVMQPAKVILVEGLFVFHFKKIRELLDIKILLDADDTRKVIRRIRRDQSERNYPVEDVLYRYENHIKPAYDKYILPYVNELDMIFNNNISFDKSLQVMRGFIRDLVR